MRDSFLVAVLGACVAALLFIGCAPGTDGLRQACANTSTLLADTYGGTTALYRADQKALRSSIKTDTIGALTARAAAHDQAFSSTLAILDTKREAVEVVCSYADAIDAGGMKNKVAELVAQVVQLATDIARAAADFQKAVK